MTIGITELPPVAKNFYTMCKKCNEERYHKVLTHTSSTSAKLECEVCHSKKTFSLPKAGKPSAAGKTPGVGRGVAARQQAAARASAKHEEEYNNSLSGSSKEDAVDYKMSTKFAAKQKVNHPKFGVGVVVAAYADKVDVIFKDDVKSLVHNRH